MDAFYALGFVHAQDRLWQMDYQRRLGKGRLAEIIGVSALPSDKLMRTLGLNKTSTTALDSLSERTLSILQAYSDGVNKGISAMSILPLEFYYYGVEAERWSPSDSLLLIKLMAMNLGANYQNELSNSILVKHLGLNKAQELLAIDASQATETPVSVQELAAMSSFYKNIEQQFQSKWEGIGSNAWVVSGQHTQSKRPMLSGDPHLRMTLPSTFYLAKLQGATLSVSGATIPGVPAIIFGHNNDIAWSGTNLAADVQDIYLERQHLVDENLFEHNGEWVPAEVSVEKILVAQEFPSFLRAPYKPIEWEVRTTKNRPLISDVFGSQSSFSLKWSALDPTDQSIQSFIDVNYATSKQEFSTALEQHHAPALAFVYGDVQGNIGLYTAGSIPNRPSANGQLPVPGWTSDHIWQGYVAYEEMPKQINPSSGVIVTANNKIHEQEYPYIISNNWQPDYRADRISHLLHKQIERGAKFSLDDMAALQSDVYDLHAEKIVPFLLKSDAKTDTEQAVIEVLTQWDKEMSAQSAGAAIFRVWSRHFSNRIIEDELKVELNYPNRLSTLEVQSQSYKPEFIAEVVNGKYKAWCDNSRTEEVESCQKIAHLSLQDTIEELELSSGGSAEDWQWGEVHKVKLPHTTFGSHPVLGKVFNKEHAAEGGLYTVNVAGGSYSKDDGYVKSLGAAYRQLIDLGDLSSARFIVDTGQSGQLLSPHYVDMAEVFEHGEYILINQSGQGENGTVREK
ncbi:hypothetical protein N480_21620 [Pseudoalteromonas luteoviolacea S2607]|nr:hypothetical protein N480_21620 [Pseudoalteromonas luteoviolacea S2607]